MTCGDFFSNLLSSGVTRRRERGDRPGWHPPGGDTRPKIIFVNCFMDEFRKKTLDKRRGKMEWPGDDSKEGRHFQKRWLKKSSDFFQGV